jgi:hypothetical protein
MLKLINIVNLNLFLYVQIQANKHNSQDKHSECYIFQEQKNLQEQISKIKYQNKRPMIYKITTKFSYQYKQIKFLTWCNNTCTLSS